MAEEEKAEKAASRIEKLRAILDKATARDEDLSAALEALAGELAQEFSGDAQSLVWREIEATDKERQVNDHFVMADQWMRGELAFKVTPEKQFVIDLLMRQTAHQTHEVAVHREMSQTVILDPPDEGDRGKARQKVFDRIFASLESQVRKSVELPEE